MGSKFSMEQTTTQLSARVAHDLEFELLPPGDGLLDQDLADRTGGQTLGRQLRERVASSAIPVPLPPRMKLGRTMMGKPISVGDLLGLAQRVREARTRHLEPDALHGGLELVTILRGGDRLGPGPDDLDPVALEHAELDELHGEVERRLPAKGRQQGVRPLLLNDPLQHLGIERLDVGAVCRARVGHDRGRVRVGQNDAVTLLGQHPAGLRARVVELTRLADHDRARPDDEDRLEVVAPGHVLSPPLSASRAPVRAEVGCASIRSRKAAKR